MPSLTATLQALVVELRATITEQWATIIRLEERVRDLETRVGQHSGNSSRPAGHAHAPAIPVTSPTSGPCRQANGRGDLPDARPGPVRLSGRGLHREHGRPCRPPPPPRPRPIPGCPGRRRTSQKVRVSQQTPVNGYPDCVPKLDRSSTKADRSVKRDRNCANHVPTR